jgi:hypothetical protein
MHRRGWGRLQTPTASWVVIMRGAGKLRVRTYIIGNYVNYEPMRVTCRNSDSGITTLELRGPLYYRPPRAAPLRWGTPSRARPVGGPFKGRSPLASRKFSR